MRRTIILVLSIAILFGGISCFSQDKKLIDINYTNKPLSEVLKDLANKFDVNVVSNGSSDQSVSCNLKEVSIEEALNFILCGTSFDFTKPNSGKETYLIFKTEENSCRVGTQTKAFKLVNLEAPYVRELISEKLKMNVRTLNEQNSILAEGKYNELKEIDDFINLVDKPVKQIELEVRLIEIDRNLLKNLRIFRDGLSFESPAVAGSGIGIFSVGPSTITDKGFIIGKITDGLNVFDFSADTWQVFNKQLAYLESKGIVQVHAYPKVVSISGRTATININDERNTVLGTAQGVSGGGEEDSFRPNFVVGVASSQKLDAVKAGTNLLITPVLGNENIITTKISIDVSDNSTINSFQNGATVPLSTFRRQINTDVQVKDGQTVAIGGLVLNKDSVNRRGLPFITSIPLLGDVLSNRFTNKSQTELVVLITPRIKDINQESIVLRKLPESIIENKYYEDQNIDSKKTRFKLFKKLLRMSY